MVVLKFYNYFILYKLILWVHQNQNPEVPLKIMENGQKGKINTQNQIIKVEKLYWRDVPMASKGEEITTIILRTLTLGVAEIWCEGKDLSHDIIVVETDKGSPYVLEWSGENKLRPGYYNKYNRKNYDEKYDYTPTNMKLSDLRNIMYNNPGKGDCKDHVRYWWKIIKKKY